MKKETKVNCEVENCKHNEEKCCCLEELDIACTCDNDTCEEKAETICNNFEKDDDDDDCEELEYDDSDNADDDYEDEEDEDAYLEETIEEYIEIEDE